MLQLLHPNAQLGGVGVGGGLGEGTGLGVGGGTVEAVQTVDDAEEVELPVTMAALQAVVVGRPTDPVQDEGRGVDVLRTAEQADPYT